jgi:hypothetical protein
VPTAPPPPPQPPPPPPPPPPARGECSGQDLTIHSPLQGDKLHCVVKGLDKKDGVLETHFEWASGAAPRRAGQRNMVDSAGHMLRGLDGREARNWLERDVGNMDGMVILHQHQGSQDSSDSGSLPPTYSRLPPDGHEFPEDYVDPSLHGFHDCGKNNIHDQEYLSRKSSASSTASLDRHELKMTISDKKYATIDDKKSGVRAKIALFSNDNSKSSQSKPTLGKFQSSEDVGKVSVGGSGSLTRAHTHSDVRYDEGLKKQGSQLSLKSLNTGQGRCDGPGTAHKAKDFSNLKPQNKSTSFRSMINVSSSQDSSSPQDDKAFSVGDLTQSTDTLIRSHDNEQVIWEETSTNMNEKPRKNPPSISNRSQSLNEIGKSQKVPKPHHDMGTQGRSRSSNVIVPSEQGRKTSMTVLIEQRRRSTMSKLKGLVIPESVTETNSVNHSSKQKSSVNEKHSVISNKVSGALPNPPWKDKNDSEEFPKYSPAFKRKPFTVYNTKNSRDPGLNSQDPGLNECERSMSPRSPHEKSESRAIHIKNLSKQQSKEQLAYKPPIGKKNSDEGLPSLPTGMKTEDSDNDSAVSSGRSSLSGRSSSPPQSPKAIRNELREKMQNNNNSNIDLNPRLLKKNSVEAINRQNVLNACKKSSATPITDINLAYSKEQLRNAELSEPPLETSSPRNTRTCGRPASRSSSFTIAERKKSFESQQSESSSSRRGSNSSQDSLSRRSSRDAFETNTNSRRSSREVMEEVNSRRSSRVTTPTGNSNYPDSILDIEEKVAYMSDVVDRASSATPTERRSVSRTNSIASERSTYSSRSSRNSSIVSEKTPFARNSSIMSKDSAISEDITKEAEHRDRNLPEEKPHKKASNSDSVSKWSELEKKYSKGLSSNSIGDKISKLSKSNTEELKNERPKDLAISHKKISNGINSPGSKNFKELAEKWQTISIDTPIYSPTAQNPLSSTLPRKSSKEKVLSSPLTSPDLTPSTLPRKHSRDKSCEEVPWSPPAPVKNSYYQVSGETEWSGFDMAGKCEIPDRKFSVPAYNESTVKLRDKKDNVPSRPSSLIESSDQKDLKIFEIGNLGDNNRLMLNSNSTSQSSSQADLLDSNSVTSDTPKSPLPSSSSREILDVFSNRNNRRAVSVNDIRRAFEKAEQSLSNSGTPKRSGLSTPSSHNRMSSLDSTTSEESSIPTPHFHGSVSSLTSGHGGDRLKDHYGSITSLASSTSMISPQELQNLIDEANQSLEESGTPSHEIMVIVLHREFSGGSIGITLAGGTDYESKEITVHKVIAGSLADRDGRIQKGDRVLSINGRSTKGVTHREALSILKAPRAEVVLVLSRSRSVTPADRNYDLIEAGYNYINSSRPPKILESPLDSKSLLADLKFVDVPRGPSLTVTLKKEGTGLGFSLEGGKDSPYGDRPMTIKKIFTGGAADKNGILKVGDEILSVNNVDVTRMTRLEAWNFMKKLNDGSQVVVVRQKLDPASKSMQREIPIVKTELVGESNPEEKTH